MAYKSTMTGRGVLKRPLTLRGLRAPEESLKAAWTLARRAVYYAAEDVPVVEAGRALSADVGQDRELLALVRDVLSFAAVTREPKTKMRALLAVEEARARLIRKRRRRPRIPGLGRAIGQRLNS